jgi:hypothetical protein
MHDSDDTLLCHRCGCALQPGSGNFYVVRIEAIADPTPPSFTTGDLFDSDPAAEIEALIAEMADSSPRELMDQVHRRLTIHLCLPCYTNWIEDPAR